MQNTVKFVNQPYDKPRDLKNLLHYAMTDKQTGTWCEYTGGINTVPLYALDEMMYVKKFFRKTEGRQLRQYYRKPGYAVLFPAYSAGSLFPGAKDRHVLQQPVSDSVRRSYRHKEYSYPLYHEYGKLR